MGDASLAVGEALRLLAATLGFAFGLIHHRYHERRRQLVERRT